MKKILMVINTLEVGGAEKIIIKLSNELVDRGYGITVYLLKAADNYLEKQLSSKVRLVSNSKRNIFCYSNFKNLNREIKDHDIVHVHLFPGLYIVSLLTFFNKRKFTIYTEHSTTNKRRKFSFLKYFERVVYSRYKIVTCINKNASDILLKWLGVEKFKVRVISNFIDFSEINKAIPIDRFNLGFANSDVLLVMTGRFSYEKDQKTVIRALTLLPIKYKLIFIGDGNFRNSCEDFAKSCQIKDRINFIGNVSNVIEILKSCNIGILSSHFEGLSVAVLEYIACGLPTIVSNVPGLNELINQKEALFELGNHEELANKIVSLSNHPEKKEALKYIQSQPLKNYKLETVIDKYIEIYNG